MGARIRRRLKKLLGAKMDPKPNPEANSDADQPIAWRAVPEDTAVRSDGQQVGRVYDVMGWSRPGSAGKAPTAQAPWHG